VQELELEWPLVLPPLVPLVPVRAQQQEEEEEDQAQAQEQLLAALAFESLRASGTSPALLGLVAAPRPRRRFLRQQWQLASWPRTPAATGRK
jgi:hypothetical protein